MDRPCLSSAEDTWTIPACPESCRRSNLWQATGLYGLLRHIDQAGRSEQAQDRALSFSQGLLRTSQLEAIESWRKSGPSRITKRYSRVGPSCWPTSDPRNLGRVGIALLAVPCLPLYANTSVDLPVASYSSRLHWWSLLSRDCSTSRCRACRSSWEHEHISLLHDSPAPPRRLSPNAASVKQHKAARRTQPQPSGATTKIDTDS